MGHIGPINGSIADLVIVGAGAAGLWGARVAGARACQRRQDLRIVLLDGRAKIGAKILMSGGTRCNLTHIEVHPEDYRGGNKNRIARVLRAHPAQASRRAFEEDLGVPVKVEEATGKIFPADDRAATVLAALQRAAEAAGASLVTGARWSGLDRAALEGAEFDAGRRGPAWLVRTVDPQGHPHPPIPARRLLVCTGGCSYPNTGSDGRAWEVLRALGHQVVHPVPALSPLLLRGGFHATLSGIALPARLWLLVDGREECRAEGPLLFAHFGLSGPAALDLSGPWARARADRPDASRQVFASFLPDESAASLDARWLREAREHSTRTLRGLLPDLPHRLVDALAGLAETDPHRPLAQTPRTERRAMIARLVQCPLDVEGVAGFRKAEVTSGGIPLEEVDAGLESRILPGVHFAGEALHVDGRLGGFNFQWAWSSATVAAEAAVDRLAQEKGER